MRPMSSIGIGGCSSSPTSTSSPANSFASSRDSSRPGFSTSSTTTFEAKISRPVSGAHSTCISSPDLNCLRAAARTASLTASMTMSRSMPCSLQTASMLWPMVALINFFRLLLRPPRPRSSQRAAASPAIQLLVSCRLRPAAFRGALSFLRQPELFLDVYLQVRLGDLGEGDADAPRSLVVEEHVVAFEPGDAAAEVALPADGPARLHLRHLPGEALVVARLVEPALQTRRGDLKGVRA